MTSVLGATQILIGSMPSLQSIDGPGCGSVGVVGFCVVVVGVVGFGVVVV